MLSRNFNLLLAIVYVIILYWITVFGREELPKEVSNWEPLWTYKAIEDGKEYLIDDVRNNIVMFVPVGALLGILLNRQRFVLTMLIGIGLSLGIELLQLNLKRGLCETDDILHNTLGCLLGLATASLIRYYYNKKRFVYR